MSVEDTLARLTVDNPMIRPTGDIAGVTRPEADELVAAGLGQIEWVMGGYRRLVLNRQEVGR